MVMELCRNCERIVKGEDLTDEHEHDHAYDYDYGLTDMVLRDIWRRSKSIN